MLSNTNAMVSTILESLPSYEESLKMKNGTRMSISPPPYESLGYFFHDPNTIQVHTLVDQDSFLNVQEFCYNSDNNEDYDDGSESDDSITPPQISDRRRRNAITPSSEKKCLKRRPVFLRCQFCNNEVTTETENIHLKDISKSLYGYHLFKLIVSSVVPLSWPVAAYGLKKKSWIGTEHICPQCNACVGIHFNRHFTGFARTPYQPLSTIPRNPHPE